MNMTTVSVWSFKNMENILIDCKIRWWFTTRTICDAINWV